MKSFVVVVGVVKFKDKILLLKRKKDSYNAANKWEFVSGYIKEFEPCEQAVLREVKEETNLEGNIIFSGNVLEIKIEEKRWIVVPFLISVNSNKIKIDPEEHSDFAWIKVEEIKKYDFIEGLDKDLISVNLLKYTKSEN